MKNTILSLILCSLVSMTALVAQNTGLRPKLAVLNIDTENIDITPEQMGSLTRLELDKLGIYEVMDRYDVAYMIDQKGLKIENCYGKICMIEVGQQLGMDKMLTGNVERLADAIIVNFRLVDIPTQSVEKSKVIEFLNLEDQLPLMVSLTIQAMLDMEYDQELYTKLTQENDFENTINTPESDRLKLDGPRTGLTVYTCETASIWQGSEASGGFDGLPVLFQFGYQFEVAYLNQGNFQALFEFIPIITGLDQGQFIPSISVLNGLRSNKNGWEFAFGPIFFLTRTSEGYFEDVDGEQVWKLREQWNQENEGANPNELVNRLDSRGNPKLGTGFLFAIGKTFKSGRLNIPVNAFFVPEKTGSRFGLSVGFNASKYRDNR